MCLLGLKKISSNPMATGSSDEPNGLVEVKEMFATLGARLNSLESRVTDRSARLHSLSLSGCDGDSVYSTEGRDSFRGAWRNASNSELRPRQGCAQWPVACSISFRTGRRSPAITGCWMQFKATESILWQHPIRGACPCLHVWTGRRIHCWKKK